MLVLSSRTTSKNMFVLCAKNAVREQVLRRVSTQTSDLPPATRLHLLKLASQMAELFR